MNESCKQPILLKEIYGHQNMKVLHYTIANEAKEKKPLKIKVELSSCHHIKGLVHFPLGFFFLFSFTLKNSIRQTSQVYRFWKKTVWSSAAENQSCLLKQPLPFLLALRQQKCSPQGTSLYWDGILILCTLPTILGRYSAKLLWIPKQGMFL